MPTRLAPRPEPFALSPVPSSTLHDISLAGRQDTLHDVAVARDVHGGHEARTGEKRQYARKAVRYGVLTIPVTIDGAPDWDHRQTATTVDVGVEGIGLVLDQPVELAATALLLGFAGETAVATHFIGVEVIHSRRTRQNHLRLGCRFGGFADELLLPKNLTPKLDQHTLRFSLAYPEEILEAWARIGVLTPVSWDRVQVCPHCQCLPSFRPGCAACGSARLDNECFIHHFACAHVGRIGDFEAPGELVCPKCRTHALVIGSDFEYHTGPYRCEDCGWSGDEHEHVAECLRCSFRFPAHQAHLHELKGYHAHRLDPLALVAASQ